MTAKKHAARILLEQTTDSLRDEVLTGKWSHIVDWRSKPISELTEILAELERRCPGHTKQTYQDALARSCWNNR
jgi:hypothetical protein